MSVGISREDFHGGFPSVPPGYAKIGLARTATFTAVLAHGAELRFFATFGDEE